MKIEIHLNNGLMFTADVDGYNGEDFAKALNNPQTGHVNIGDVVIQKHSILIVMPAVEPTE